MKQSAFSGNEVEVEQIYLSCSAEDLIAVEMEAWKLGYEGAAAQESALLLNLAAVEAAAEAVCDQELSIYVPLDLARFRDVFIRAWCGGYCTRLRELQSLAAAPVIH